MEHNGAQWKIFCKTLNSYRCRDSFLRTLEVLLKGVDWEQIKPCGSSWDPWGQSCCFEAMWKLEFIDGDGIVLFGEGVVYIWGVTWDLNSNRSQFHPRFVECMRPGLHLSRFLRCYFAFICFQLQNLAVFLMIILYYFRVFFKKKKLIVTFFETKGPVKKPYGCTAKMQIKKIPSHANVNFPCSPEQTLLIYVWKGIWTFSVERAACKM